jgi:hypothetical protein
VPIGDELISFQSPPKKISESQYIFGYAGNDVWESDGDTIKRINFNHALGKFFTYRTNLITPRIIQIPK